MEKGVQESLEPKPGYARCSIASPADSLRIRHAFLSHELVRGDRVTNPRDSLRGRLVLTNVIVILEWRSALHASLS